MKTVSISRQGSGAKMVMYVVFAFLCLLTPCLWAATYSGGSGTSGNPYRISSAANWQTLAATPADWNKFFILTTNLNLSGVAITPVGNTATWFTGGFDGGGYVISNAVINMPDGLCVGLFGCLSNPGWIYNLGVENVNITGLECVGGLCGENDGGTIVQCHSTGTVKGNDYGVGGLCGWNDEGWLEGGMIKQSYSACKVTGVDWIGGLCGYNMYGTIVNSYATGAVTGSGYCTGGLCGVNDEDCLIDRCYSAGKVKGRSAAGGLCGYSNLGTATASFWDKNTSGKTSSAGGTGKTTAEMKTLSTFTSAGWDFVGESANGSDDIWDMSEGLTYPMFDVVFNPSIEVTKCTVAAGKNIPSDSIAISGVLNYAGALAGAAIVHVEIDCPTLLSSLLVPFEVNDTTFKNGKFSAKVSNAPSSYTFTCDTKTGKFAFTAKKEVLQGLCCPFNLYIIINPVAGQAVLDEAIVNSAKKPCPLQLIMGVMDTLAVNTCKFKLSDKPGGDSFTVQGTFTIDSSYIKSSPLVISLGGQTFFVPGDAMKDKNDVASCSNITSTGGAVVTSKLDYSKCTFSVTVKNIDINQSGDVKFALNCFGNALPGETVTIP